MKVLVTGSSGFVGGHLLPVLKKAGHQVTKFDIVEGDDIFSDKFGFVVSVSDVVIHLAGYVNVEKSFVNPQTSFHTNVLGTARVVEKCLEHKKKLIFASSAAIYHPELSPYALHKKLAEDIVAQAIDSLPATILRFFNIYGKGMTPESGSVMYRFLTDKKMVIFGDGEATRDYINIEDIVNIIAASIDNKWNGKIVDCGSGQAYSTNYIAGLFAHYRKKKLYYEPPRREIKWSIANIEMLKTLYEKPLLTNPAEDIKKLCQK